MRFLYLVLFFILSSELLGVEIESQEDQVPVFAKPEESSTLIRLLKKGETFDHANRIGMFWEIPIFKGLGYAPFSKMAVKNPGKKTTLERLKVKLQKAKRDEEDPANIRSRLYPIPEIHAEKDTDVEAIQNTPPNYHMIFLMESLRTPKTKVDLLAKEIKDELASLQGGRK